MDQPLRTIAGLVDGVAVDVEVYPDRLEWRQWAAGRRLLDPVSSGTSWLATAAAAPDEMAGNVALALVSNVVVWRASSIYTAVSVDAAGTEVEFRIDPEQAAEIAGLFVNLLLPSRPVATSSKSGVPDARRPVDGEAVPVRRGRGMSEEIRILRDAVERVPPQR